MNASPEPEDKSADKDAVDAAPEPPITTDPVEPPVTTAVSESVPEPVDAVAAAEETVTATEDADNNATETPPVASEETQESTDEENTVDETPEIKVPFIGQECCSLVEVAKSMVGQFG